VNVERSLAIEAEIHHDLMAEVKAFAEQCPVGGGIIHLGATSMAFSPNGKKLYVSNRYTENVMVITVATSSVTSTIDLPDNSWPDSVAISPNGKTLYVANSGTGNVSIITLSTEAVTTIAMPEGAQPWSVAVNRSGKKTYVVNGGIDSVSVLQ
jgi:YVTN family beta-propeller protein